VVVAQQGVDNRAPAGAVGHGAVALFAHFRVVVGHPVQGLAGN
jgi:hypothetical protein